MEKKKTKHFGEYVVFLIIFLFGLLIGRVTNSEKKADTSDKKAVNSLMKIIDKKDSCLLFTRELLKKEKEDSRKRLDSLVDASSQKVKMDSSLFMKGLVEGKKVGRKELLDFMIVQHRNLPPSKKDSFLFADKANRVHMLPDWSISFTHLHDLFPDWEFLDSMYQIFVKAKVLPIYIADTLGSTSIKKQRHLSIIPLEDNEYLIYRGKNEEAAGYYQTESNMIVLRDNHMDTSVSKYSFWNASILLHELCHYYLTHKKYRGNEHEYIKQVLYLLHDKIENLYPGKSPEEAEDLFEVRRD